MAKRKRYTQKALIKMLKDHGWERSVGGKHQVKMTREGHRPVTIPEFKGETLASRPLAGDPQAGRNRGRPLE